MLSTIYFLFEKVNFSNWFIQTTYGNPRNKKAFFWYTGNSIKPVPSFIQYSNNSYLLGITGKCLKTFEKTQEQQPLLLAFVTLDIDNTLDYDEILREIPEASIRTSTSGKGLHVFIRLEEPKEFYNIGSLRDYASMLSKKLAKNIKNTIIDKHDHRTLWIWGGKQKWLYKNELFLNPEKSKINYNYEHNSEQNSVHNCEQNSVQNYEQLEFSENLIEALNTLKKIGVFPKYLGKINVYVKEIFEIFKNTENQFETKSPMVSSSYHTNGFIYFNHMGLFLYTNIDNRFVLNILNFKQY